MQEQNLSMSSTQAGVPLGVGNHSLLGGDPTLPTHLSPPRLVLAWGAFDLHYPME